LLLSLPAKAQISPGKLRLHLDTKLFSYTHYKIGTEIDGTTTFSEYDLVTLGPGAVQSYYFSQPQFGLGFGGVVVEGLTIGGRLDLGFGTVIPKDSDEDYYTLVIRAVPYVEYAFPVKGPVRPFILALIGYEGALSLYKSSGYESKAKMHGFIVGGGFGCHFFLVSAFSLDLTLLATYKHSKAEDEFKDTDDGGSWETDDPTIGKYFSLDLLLGFSGWF
jgi:hypothetical protein